MRNSYIIEKAKSELVSDGIIRSDEGIFTKNSWRKMGYRVKKEENPIVTLPIHICIPFTEYRNGVQVQVRRMLGVRANFYTSYQVSEIKKGA